MHHSLSTSALAACCLVSSLTMTACKDSKAAKTPGPDKLEPLPAIAMPKMAPDEQAPPPTAYKLAPSCVLQYRFNVDMGQEVLGKDAQRVPKMSTQMRGGFFMSAEGDRFTLKNDAIEMNLAQGGVRRPGNSQARGTLADVHLKPSGGGVVEVDGPTGIWSAYGTFAGLVHFFPTLPDASGEGTWTLKLHARGSGMAVEAARGTADLQGREAPKPTSQEVTATVHVIERLRIGGQPAVRLLTRWSDNEDGGTEGMSTKVATQATGRYLVLTSGRLLSADLEQVSNVEMGMGGQVRMRQRMTTKASARLVKACDGPVVPEVGPKPATDPELALVTLQQFRNYMVLEQWEDAASLFSSDVKRRHGLKKLAAALENLVDKGSPRIIGAPEIFHKELTADGGVYRVELVASVASDGRTRRTVMNVFEVIKEGDDLVIQRFGIASAQPPTTLDTFEVSTEKMSQLKL